MRDVLDFFQVIRDSLPKGRAFNLPFGNDHYKFHRGSALQPKRMYDFYNEVRNCGIPSEVMLAGCLEDWENELGFLSNANLTDEERRERIIGKYYSVGGQGPDYIQNRFQAAGFQVFVYENNPQAGARQYTTVSNDFQSGDALSGDFTDRIDPRSLGGILYANPPIFESRKDYIGSQSGDTGVEAGDFQSGEFTKTIIDEFVYLIPPDSTTYIFFWFLAGSGGIFDFVDIPADRQTDFENLIFQLKPAHTWVIAQVNFV